MEKTLHIFTFFVVTNFICFIGCEGKYRKKEVTLSNVTDSEIRELTEELFRNENLDIDRTHVSVNLQGRAKKGRNTDLAPEPLLTVDQEILDTPSIKSLYNLFDNYELNTREAEIVTPDEIIEQETFLDNLLNHDSVYRVMSFLSGRGFISEGNQTYRNTLSDLWFTQYARQKKYYVIGSSGFEHTFLGELKSGTKLMGLHNWIYFNVAEKSGRINYLGYRAAKAIKNSTISLVNAVYTYSGKTKMSGMMIGSSPELEIATYTLCYLTRPNKYCRVSMGGTRFGIQTWATDHTGNKPPLGAVYPVIQ